MESLDVTPAFWRGRRVFLTGHTGFKGAWLALWLESLGAEVTAVALPPATEPSLFEALAPWPGLRPITGDLREPGVAGEALRAGAPEVVIHMAAQALVRESHRDPVGTFATNVLGTVHVLEAVRETPSVRVVLVVTSDKVYANDGSGRPFREGDRLGGGDPYSSSKTCQEIVAACYRDNFFAAGRPRIAVARAGNVIGGGDWAADRLVPDFVRAAASAQPLVLRHPEATRPWQHVLDPLAGYLIYIERLYGADGGDLPAALNFGPPAASVRPVGRVVDALAERWGGGVSRKKTDVAPAPEATALALDASLAQRSLGWRPRLDFARALDRTVAWYRAHREGDDMRAYSLDDLRRYAGLSG